MNRPATAARRPVIYAGPAAGAGRTWCRQIEGTEPTELRRIDVHDRSCRVSTAVDLAGSRIVVCQLHRDGHGDLRNVVSAS